MCFLTQHASDWSVGRFETCQRISAPSVLVLDPPAGEVDSPTLRIRGSGPPAFDAPGSRHVPSVCSLREVGDCPWGAADRASADANLRRGSDCGFCRSVVESRSLPGNQRCAPYCPTGKAGEITVGVQSSGDIEQSESWLDGLFRLNRVIAESGVPLEGNLFYDHHDPFVRGPPPRPALARQA